MILIILGIFLLMYLGKFATVIFLLTHNFYRRNNPTFREEKENRKIMQKVITVSLDATELNKKSNSKLDIFEVDAINDYLTGGWEIQEWEVLTHNETTGCILLWIILTDEAESFLGFGETDPEDQDDF